MKNEAGKPETGKCHTDAWPDVRSSLLLIDLVKAGVVVLENGCIVKLHSKPPTPQNAKDFRVWWNRKNRQERVAALMTVFKLTNFKLANQARDIDEAADFVLTFMREYARIPEAELRGWLEAVAQEGEAREAQEEGR